MLVDLETSQDHFWQPTPVFLPGESQGRGSLVGCLYGVAQSRTRLKGLSSSSSSSKIIFIWQPSSDFPSMLTLLGENRLCLKFGFKCTALK